MSDIDRGGERRPVRPHEGSRMTDHQSLAGLGESLRTERRRRRMSLRDLADEIGVSFNTLSRVERGHLPELKNYERIAKWLDAPGQSLFATDEESPSTPELIAKHLYTDSRLDPDAATKIMSVIQDLYANLAAPKPAFSVHLRSSQTFLPEVGTLLAGALTDMHTVLSEEAR
ncbi:helix-turn-helix domain-containing protein [Phycicoccus jejuensis]|uniref:helix-turn-helix domain-containing protein n=1 Tax=Phycicoccus jejuensis TaxID=367299 RepID=UPI00384D9B77